MRLGTQLLTEPIQFAFLLAPPLRETGGVRLAVQWSQPKDSSSLGLKLQRIQSQRHADLEPKTLNWRESPRIPGPRDGKVAAGQVKTKWEAALFCWSEHWWGWCPTFSTNSELHKTVPKILFTKKRHLKVFACINNPLSLCGFCVRLRRHDFS